MKYIVKEKVFRLGQDNDILNEAGQPVYKVDGKALSLHNTMRINDLSGNELAVINRKLLAMRSTYEIAMTSGATATVKQKFSNPLRPKWAITTSEGAELELIGNFSGHKFTIAQGGATVATGSKAWIAMADTYGVDIADGQNDLLILCSVLSLEAEQDRNKN